MELKDSEEIFREDMLLLMRADSSDAQVTQNHRGTGTCASAARSHSRMNAAAPGGTAGSPSAQNPDSVSVGVGWDGAGCLYYRIPFPSVTQQLRKPIKTPGDLIIRPSVRVSAALTLGESRVQMRVKTKNNPTSRAH